MAKITRCLVTGGSGFIGQNLINSLLKKKYEVICLDRYKPKWIHQGIIKFIEGDFCATHLLRDAIRDCDIVFHLAYTTLPKTSNEDPDFDVSSNVLGTIRMLDEAVKAKAKKFIFMSSGGTVYGRPSIIPTLETHPNDPICSYGITKLTIEKYLKLYSQLHGLHTCSIRLANPYGEYQRVDSIQGAIAVFCHKAITNQEIHIWGDGSVRRDFIYISDVTDAILKIAQSPIESGEINIGSGRSESLNELLDAIEEILGKETQRIYEPSRNFDIPISFLDISKAKALLDWTPKTDFIIGVKKTINWIRNNISVPK